MKLTQEEEVLRTIGGYLGGWREAIGLLEDYCADPVKLKNMIAAIDQIDYAAQIINALTNVRNSDKNVHECDATGLNG